MIINPQFSEGTSGHKARVFTPSGASYVIERGEVATPVGWEVWYVHDRSFVPSWDGDNGDGWCEPEVRPNTYRGLPVPSCMFFTFYRIHQGGLAQLVHVGKGNKVRFSMQVHAWSSNDDNAATSEGCGAGPYFACAGDVPEGPQHDALINAVFQVGVDPLGRDTLDPFASEVVWGRAAHVYNEFHEIEVEAVAQSDYVWLIVKGLNHWRYKHNDMYYDDARIEVFDAPVESCHPREDFHSVYALIPPGHGFEWFSVLKPAWDAHRFTIGGSADHAAYIPGVSRRTVLALNPESWPGDLSDFFSTYYPNTTENALEYVPIEAATPDEWLAGVLAYYRGGSGEAGGGLPVIQDVRDQLAVNADSPWYPWQRRTLAEISHVFVHHSAGAASSDLVEVARIALYHTSPSGKDRPGICYTFVIGADGTIWHTSDIENVVFSQGSATHPGDENRFGVGVCLLGNFTAGKEPTPAQLSSLEKLIGYLERIIGRVLMVWGHKDVITTQCPGDSWPFKPGWGKAADGAPAPYMLKSPNAIGLHVMQSCPAVDTYIREAHPRVVKVFSAGEAAHYKALWPQIITVWRKHTYEDYSYVNAPDQRAAANRWIDLYEAEGLGQHLGSIDVIESVNETIGTFTGDQIHRSVAFDRIFLEELHRRFPTVAGEVLTIPVGNPHETEFVHLLPAVEAACRYKGFVGYHAYWTAHPGKNWLAEKWRWHAGRWTEMDRVFNAYGYYPWYIFSECGIVYNPSGQGDDMTSSMGWKNCGDFPTYLAQIQDFQKMLAAWNAEHQNRAIGGTLFTVGGDGWHNFWIGNGDLLLLNKAFKS